MQNGEKIAGYAVVVLVMIIAAAAAVFALGNNGTMGIGERFQSALGLSDGQGTDGYGETIDVRSDPV